MNKYIPEKFMLMAHADNNEAMFIGYDHERVEIDLSYWGTVHTDVLPGNMVISPLRNSAESIIDCYRELERLYTKDANGFTFNKAMDVIENTIVLNESGKTIAQSRKETSESF